MQRVTSRLRSISEMLTDFARQRKQKMEPVEIRPVIEEAWSLVGIDDRAAQIAYTNAVPEGQRVVGAAGRLVQVFVNLLRNAMQSSAGEIEVRSRCLMMNGKPFVAITIEDNGPGIRPTSCRRSLKRL